jgi:hypothetical protein
VANMAKYNFTILDQVSKTKYNVVFKVSVEDIVNYDRVTIVFDDGYQQEYLLNWFDFVLKQKRGDNPIVYDYTNTNNNQTIKRIEITWSMQDAQNFILLFEMESDEKLKVLKTPLALKITNRDGKNIFADDQHHTQPEQIPEVVFQ